MSNQQFFLGHAEHAGSDHIKARRAGQDRAGSGQVSYKGNTYHFGFVLDGNGTGFNSEFGAIIGRYHLLQEVARLITDGCPLQDIPQQLFDSLEDELRRHLPVCVPKAAAVDFILNYLLFTTLGFVQGPEETIVFYMGDGLILINGEEILGLDNKQQKKDAPDYVAYQLLGRLDATYWQRHTDFRVRSEVYVPPDHFQVIVCPTATTFSLLIGSDAWLDEEEAAAYLAWELLKLVDPTNPDCIQEQVNMWAGIPFRAPYSQLYFSDDVSVVVLTAIN